MIFFPPDSCPDCVCVLFGLRCSGLAVNLIDTGALAAAARACVGNEDVADAALAAATAEDDDVSAERQRVERVHIVSSSSSAAASSAAETTRPDTITLTNLRKVYDTNQGAAGEGCCASSSAPSSSSNQFNAAAAIPPSTKKVAVRRLTLGIPDGQCFGLLGTCSLNSAREFRIRISPMFFVTVLLYVKLTPTYVSNPF